MCWHLYHMLALQASEEMDKGGPHGGSAVRAYPRSLHTPFVVIPCLTYMCGYKATKKRFSPGQYGSVGASSRNLKVSGSILDQSTYLGCGFDLRFGCVWEATILCFSLTLTFLSHPPSSLKAMKNILR